VPRERTFLSYVRGMTDVNLSSGPPETVLPAPPGEAASQLDRALELPPDRRKAAFDAVVARYPRYIDAWAQLGRVARDDIEAYAYYRVGYHRGLDTLRASGWRGSGYVRWVHETNRGFLRALEGLERTAGKIGESDEQERCALFLRQLDPTWPPADFD
jgi:hypothetical protein